MNYVREINAFYDRIETNGLSLSAIALWHALMHINNKAAWTDEFAVSVSVLCVKSSLSPRGVAAARNELAMKGYITWRSRKGNQSAYYRMISLAEQLQALYADKRADNHAGNHTDNDTDNRADNRAALNKQKQNKTKPKPSSKIDYAEFVSMSESEHQQLVDEHGEEDTRRMVEILNNYKGSNGKTYKSDYRAILSWVVNRLGEEKTRAGLNKSPPEKVLCNGDEILW